MRCPMTRYLNLATISAAVWWVTVLLGWVDVFDQHSSDDGFLGRLAGTELSAIWGLLPAIVLLMTVMARYRSLRLVMPAAASLVSIAALIISFSEDFGDSGAIENLIATSTGILGAAGVQASLLFGFYAYQIMSAVTFLALLFGLFARGKNSPAGSRVRDESEDSPNLWDEQSN